MQKVNAFNKMLLIFFVFVAAILSSIFWDTANLNNSEFEMIFFDIRLPRMIIAVYVGIVLSVAGVLSQALFRNALASPSVIGCTSGASLGAIVVLMFSSISSLWWALPTGAFIGCMATSLLMLLLAIFFHWNVYKVLLVGIAINAFIGASASLLLSQMLQDQVKMVTAFHWLFGGLTARGWVHLLYAMPFGLIGFMLALWLSHKLDVMVMGLDWAKSLGVSVRQSQVLSLIAISLLVGSAVAIAGGIAFVGLIVPHITRLLCGPRHLKLIFLSSLLGSSLVLFADLIARHVSYPIEIQLGILTSFAGGVFFLFLLCFENYQIRQRSRS